MVKGIIFYTVDVHVGGLREKSDEDPIVPSRIVTVQGT